jgi:CheY-like chemotaxis protein
MTSQCRKGSVFTIHLAVAGEPSPAQPGASPERGRTAPAVSRRILVVDDESISATSLSKVLQIANYETRLAYDGLEALRVAEAFRPGVVLLDIGLPKMNGFGVAHRLRQQPWGGGMLPIALTGGSQETDRDRTTEVEFDHHLVKSVNTSALLHLLASLP